MYYFWFLLSFIPFCNYTYIEKKHSSESQTKNYKRTRSKSNSDAAVVDYSNDSKRSKFSKEANEKLNRPVITSFNSLVWAKQKGFPFFPAKIVNYKKNQANVPKILLKEHESKEFKNTHVLVRFFDTNMNWSLVPIKDVYFLGKDDCIDEKMLHKQKSGKKSQLKAAYRLALANR